jgi:L-glutamine:2-deoxy-scyllo-inosose/3-amino-2,3-dideoxy-scyllo-inosose aminotransferase
MNTDKLAALGGKPIFAKPLQSPWPTPWPPTNKVTERALVKLYRSQTWSWNGPWERKFAADFARLHTARYAVSMANGTVTLEAALHVLGVGPGDEVIVPSLTWLATATAVLYVGAKPVFVDVEPDTLCLDPIQTAAAITRRTKAIIPVHLYGGMADMDRLLALARKHKLKVIEDCAHAHGGMWNGRGLGSLGDIGSFSFQQSKPVSSGEGGCVVTNSDRLLERLFRFKNIGYDLTAKQGKANSGPPPDLLCHNYRGTEFHAAVLHGQLAGLRALTIRRNRAADFLTRELEKIPGVTIQARGRKATRGRQSYYSFITVLDLAQWGGVTNGTVIRALNAEGVPVISTYGSVYRHPLWNAPKSKYRIHSGQISDEVGTARCVGLLHWYLDLPQHDLEKIVAAYAKVQRHAGLLRRLT